MGWTSQQANLQQVLAKHTARREFVRDGKTYTQTTIASVWKGSLTRGDGVLWSVFETTVTSPAKDVEVRRYIVALITKRHEDGWATKPISEMEGPCNIPWQCPLEYLELAPNPPKSQFSSAWRKKVVEHYERCK